MTEWTLVSQLSEPSSNACIWAESTGFSLTGNTTYLNSGDAEKWSDYGCIPEAAPITLIRRM